jgi:hypothetical protein
MIDDPTRFQLSELSRQQLAMLGREWLLHGHLQDRVGMPLVMADGTREEMQAVAIVEWMSASPVYSRRVQRALNFQGDGVDTIMKNLQVDIGTPHRFMDVRSTVHDHDHAEFVLAHCGALMDVEPMGDEFVLGMCHTIEDPTFDATAAATNPRARIRPIHRPPRVPVDRRPHCHWTVTIDEAYSPVSVHPNVAVVQRSLLAQCDVEDPGVGRESGGLPDYSGPFDAEFTLEQLSQRALVVTLQEIAIQSHLLLRGYCMAVSERRSAAAAIELAARVAVGLGGLTSQRLTKAFDLQRGLGGLASMLLLHPFFWPRTYVRPTIHLDAEKVRFALLADSPIFYESDGFTWLQSAPGAFDRAIVAIAQGFDRRATAVSIPTAPGERCAYELFIRPEGESAPEQPEVTLARFSTGADFEIHHQPTTPFGSVAGGGDVVRR